ncbi:MAG: hypothetical protein REI78_04650 [Pedobacter sp.]|nr:hypothetical protein [Pedobacter sp.]
MKLTDFLLQKWLLVPEDYLITLGDRVRERSTIATIYVKPLWKKTPIVKKVLAILTKSWKPSEEVMQKEAELIFSKIFGGINDYGPVISKLMQWHQTQHWEIQHVTETDREKARGLDTMTIMNQMQMNRLDSPLLKLNLAKRVPLMCTLTQGMVAKIPVCAMQYHLDIDSLFAFDSIRKANHQNAEELIAYIYEIIFIQHKIFDSLLTYLKLYQEIMGKKQDSSMLVAEFKTIKEADIIFTYLKASIEKTVALLAAIFNIKKLDEKKTHKQRLGQLNRELPEFVKDVPYFGFVWKFISSENLDELNKYRTGLLHKRGISDLQPHSYVGMKPNDLPLMKVYNVLHEQHSINTAVLLGVLALLTDELVKLDRPTILPWDIPRPNKNEVPDGFFESMFDQELS